MPRLKAENRKWWILATMTGALSMILIDETVVGVALPTIQRDLHMTPTALQWVVNAYLLALAALVAVGGRVGELLGQARIFRLGAAIFVTASVACGLAQSATWMIGARAAQGVGAAMMIPPSGATVMNAFDVTERGRAMGIYAGISMIFLALGPLAGGLLTQGISWRAVFWINLPLGAAMLALAAVSLPTDEPASGARMDWYGAVTLVPGLVMIVLALMQSEQWGWGASATISLLAAGSALIATFAVIEARSHSPLVQLKLFRSRNFAVDNLVLGVVQFALTGLTVFGAIYVQELLGFGPITAGLSLLPLTVPLLLLAPRAGKLYDRIGPRALVAAGTALLGASMIWSAAWLARLQYAWLAPAYVAGGIGLAVVMTPASTDAMNTAAPSLRSQASGVMQTIRQIGGALGLAIMGTAVASVQHARLTDFANRVGATALQRAYFQAVVAAAHGDPAILKRLPVATLAALKDSLISGIETAYYLAGGVLLAAAILAGLLLRRVRPADAGPALQVPVTPGAHPALEVAGVAAPD